MNRAVVITGTAATAAVGYAIACWLARATDFAERVDADLNGHHQVPAVDRVQPAAQPV